MYDLVIIGGGPCGYTAAERAGAEGLKTALFEKKALGGVCLNEGCIPTKTLLYSAKIYDTARSGDKYGVTAGDVAFDYKKIVDRKNRVVRRLVAGVGAKMKAHGVEVVTGEAYIEGRSDDGIIEVSCNGEKYRAKNLLVATGSEAAVPPIPGLKEAGEHILTNREVLAMTERPESLVIIGGGVIGMEFASFFNSLGTKVTVIEMLDKVLGPMDAELSAMLMDTYAKKGVEFHLRSAVVEIDGNRIVYETDGERHPAEGDKILLSVGRRRNLDGYGLENLGVGLDGNRIKVNDRMQTDVPGLFAAGDVAGEFQLAHTAVREAEVVVNNLTGKDDRMSYAAVPAVVYTNPEIAGAGLTEAVAAAKGIPCRAAKLPMAYSGRFVAENEGVNGVCKVLVNEKGEVIGVHMLGNPAGEIIYGAALAIEQKMTIDALKKIIFPHPTVSEILKEVIFTFGEEH